MVIFIKNTGILSRESPGISEVITRVEKDLGELKELLTRYRTSISIIDLMPMIHEPSLTKFISEFLMNNNKVAYLGPEGSYSHEVALQLFSKNADLTPLKSIGDIVKCVYQGDCGFGVIPIENNQAGVVGESMDSLVKWGVYVNHAVEYKVSLCLVVNEGTNINDINEVYSHPHAINEALNFISRLNASINYTQSTSEALRLIKGYRHKAAIASRIGAEIHGLRPLICGIEDNPNYTRFLVISRHMGRIGDRTMAIFSVPNKPGSLFNALKPFADLGINLSMIYSRPNRASPWGYDFLLETECQLTNEACRRAFDELSDMAVYVKLLGSYSIMRIY
ncbi:prephenate dehydratase [Vulcanisaeta souniana]|uniref:Chorismate mutase n=1 Tax=Vulcanisaeta souniana JCM 11219 TaxID=1293586 RepID=A0A830E8X0_9CREN|nr:prephenate dehydratase domain-containing protein [Vulcanisaeta souniana]BDR92533.1 chorismate mutase [Vulcanisaeta souniana JCM 11219]GGI83096.1 chorismate mutase [Vulcanisaeta souniana JCM 11219]